MGILHGLPIISTLFNEIQKKKKTKEKQQRKKKQKKKLEYCSEAVLKVRYIIYTENKNAT